MKKKIGAPAPGTKESGKAAGRGKAGSRVFAVLLMLVLVFCLGYATSKQFVIERDTAYTSLHDSMYTLRSLISFEGGLEDAFIDIRDKETVMYAELAKPFFEYLGVSAETLKACKYNWDADTLYYYADDGSVLTTENAEPFSLNKSQTRMLKTVGMLIQGDWVYNAARLQDGWLFIKWSVFPNIYNVDFQRIAQAVPSDLCIIENATGNVLFSSSEKPYDFLDESRVTFDD